MNRPTFLGLPDAGEDAQVALVTAPYDATSTWGKGADRGPEALLAASANVETWEEESGVDLETLGATVRRPDDEAAFGRLAPEAMVEQLATTHGELLDAGLFCLGLGGEHSITYGQFSALHARHPELAVVQVDAHLDLRESYLGSRHNHACIAARMAEHEVELVQVGARSCSREEAATVERRGLRVFWAREVVGRVAWQREVLERVAGRPVFVTVDLDGLDPSILPATGTPEPGGLGWYDLTGLLSTLARHCSVVGADITELAPGPAGQSRTSEFLAARLAAKMLAWFHPPRVRH